VDVPPEHNVPVPHVMVVEREKWRRLALEVAPPQLEESRLREGEVLLQMHAAPLCMHELGSAEAGDCFGRHGVGRVVLVGPRVDHIRVGDWAVPLCEVDSEGDLVESAPPPGTARALAVLSAARCVRLDIVPDDDGLNESRLALAKAIGAAFKIMEEECVQELEKEDLVIVNAANGTVGRVLVQLLRIRGYRVVAVIRRSPGASLVKKVLQDLGARQVFYDDEDDLLARLNDCQVGTPKLAFDGVGGEATLQIALTLGKTGDIVCFGRVGGSSTNVLPRGKRWTGQLHEVWIDEWLQQNPVRHGEILSDFLREAGRLLEGGQLRLEVEEYAATCEGLDRAVEDAALRGRAYSVVLKFDLPNASGEVAGVKTPREVVSDMSDIEDGDGKPAKWVSRSWDTAFMTWGDEDETDRGRRQEDESSLFKPDPAVEELRLKRYVDDALAARVAFELGAKCGEAAAVMMWLPNSKEPPESHRPWLLKLAEDNPLLRILVLQPRGIDTKWFDISDSAAVRLGLRYSVADDFDGNSGSDPARSVGSLVCPTLMDVEIEALQQVESAALSVARRCALEERSVVAPKQSFAPLPFFLGGSGQGGSVALYTAACLVKDAVRGVAFVHSGVPVASMLGERMSAKARQSTQWFAVYDKDDKKVPAAFAEALHQMLTIIECDVSLKWLPVARDFERAGAPGFVSECVAACLKPDFRRHMEREALRGISGGKLPPGYRDLVARPKDDANPGDAARVNESDDFRDEMAKRFFGD